MAGETSRLTRNNVPTGTRIVVNAPAYRMAVLENGTLVKTSTWAKRIRDP